MDDSVRKNIKIQEVLEKLQKKYNVAPIPIVKIAKEEFGIKSFAERALTEDMLGGFYADGTTPDVYGVDKVILVDPLLDLHWQRYIVARELCYYIYELLDEDIMHEKEKIKIDKLYNNLNQSIYDDYAIKLLIPYNRFIEHSDEAINNMLDYGFYWALTHPLEGGYYLTYMSTVFKVPEEKIAKVYQKIL